MARGPAGTWAKYGCLTLGALVAAAAIVIAVATGIAARQNRTMLVEHDAWSAATAPDVERKGAANAPLRLEIELHTAGVSVRPIAAGQGLRVDADYDPRLFALSRSEQRVAGESVIRVELRPLGSQLMALLRAKLGGQPAMLRVGLPRDVALTVDGHVVRSFALMELGGLHLTSANLEVEEGGVKLSFVEPLPEPMERLSIRGSRGSLSVAGLGNASPRTTRLQQHIGAVDVDLRGAWVRDGRVSVTGGVAGGSLWLPDNVRVVGLEGRIDRSGGEASELPRPTLELSVSEHIGRFVVMD